MEYAAVIIPTLNRKKHLKRCIESLQRNSDAKSTDLYISVDFPPAEKYQKGYPEVCEYVKTITGFATVNLYYQDKNLGPGLNRKFLEEKIAEKHDKYIFTDDDNEFSSNFLEYMNWGLEKFKDDETIYAICSCTDFEITPDNSEADYFIMQAYNPYGSGHWLHKNSKCAEYLKQKDSLSKIYKSKERQKALYMNSPMLYMWVAKDSLRRIPAMRGKNDQLTYIDIWENIYIIENNMNCIKPTLPKSRNWGRDGSGVHSDVNDSQNYVPSVALDQSGTWSKRPGRLDEKKELDNMTSHRNKFMICNKEKKKCQRIYELNALLGNKCFYGMFKIFIRIYKMITRKDKTVESEIMYG